MDVSSFSKERIINTIKQSYNFDKEIITKAKQIAIDKGLLSSFQIDKILLGNELKREEKKQANYELDKKAAFGEINSSNNFFSKWFHVIVPIAILVVCLAFYIKTGLIVLLGIGPTAAAGSVYRNKRRFGRR